MNYQKIRAHPVRRGLLRAAELAAFVEDVPDFPKPGIMFKDITPLLDDPDALQAAAKHLAAPFHDQQITRVAGIESRGFMFGCLVALELRSGFVPVRKPGKLPRRVTRVEYELEYGSDALEMHDDSMGPGDNVLIVDDLLATGGTAAATVQLVKGTGATVAGLAVVVELEALKGRERLAGQTLHTLLKY